MHGGLVLYCASYDLVIDRKTVNFKIFLNRLFGIFMNNL